MLPLLNLNTSHVKVNPKVDVVGMLTPIYLNTSHVKVNLYSCNKKD